MYFCFKLWSQWYFPFVFHILRGLLRFSARIETLSFISQRANIFCELQLPNSATPNPPWEGKRKESSPCQTSSWLISWSSLAWKHFAFFIPARECLSRYFGGRVHSREVLLREEENTVIFTAINSSFSYFSLN